MRSIPSPDFSITFPETRTPGTIDLTTCETILSTPEILTTEQKNQAEDALPIVLEIGHLNDQVLILVLEFPDRINPLDFEVSIGNRQFQCVLQQGYDYRLYCSGPMIDEQGATLILKPSDPEKKVIEIMLDLSEIQIGLSKTLEN